MLRRKMRVNPPAGPASASPSADRGSASGPAEPSSVIPAPERLQDQRGGQAEQTPRKKIISINGEDVRTEEVTNPKRRSA